MDVVGQDRVQGGSYSQGVPGLVPEGVEAGYRDGFRGCQYALEFFRRKEEGLSDINLVKPGHSPRLTVDYPERGETPYEFHEAR